MFLFTPKAIHSLRAKCNGHTPLYALILWKNQRKSIVYAQNATDMFLYIR